MSTISITVAIGNWRTSLYDRVAEVIDSDRVLSAVPGDDESPEFDAANDRVDEALRALPFWLRWIFN